MVREWTDMARRWWFRFTAVDAVTSIVMGAVVGWAINLLTGDNPTLASAAALAVALVVLVVMALKRVGAGAAAARTARSRVLVPAIPAGQLAPPPLGAAADERPRTTAGLADWLSAMHTPTPMWARNEELKTLLQWCLNEAPKLCVALVSGEAGVGKTRLAVELARKLPPFWYAGLATTAEGVAEAVEACGDPCLVIVDDAELMPNLSTLVQELSALNTRVRLLLCTRSAEPRTWQPHLIEPLRPLFTAAELVLLRDVGEESDRRRWYKEAVCAYAETWGVSPPQATHESVGRARDVMAVIHIRALLDVVHYARSEASNRAQTATALELMEALWEETATHWTGDPRLPELARSPDALAEIVVAQMLQPPTSIAESVESLRVLPRFATTDSATLTTLAEWTRNRLSSTADGYLDLRPHLLAEHLLFAAAARIPILVDVNTSDGAKRLGILLSRVIHEAERLPLLEIVLRANPTHICDLLTAIFTYAEHTDVLDRLLAGTVSLRCSPELLTMEIPPAYVHLRCNQQQVIVEDLRTRGTTIDEVTLAEAIAELADRLNDIARHKDAVPLQEEAVHIYRNLVVKTAVYRGKLADQLRSLCKSLSELESSPRLLALIDETVDLHRVLVTEGHTTYEIHLADMISFRAAILWRIGRTDEGFASDVEAVELARTLLRQKPRDARRISQLAIALDHGANSLRAQGRHEEALSWSFQAMDLFRALAATEEEGHMSEFARAAMNLSSKLNIQDRDDDALEVENEGIVALRRLAFRNADRYGPDLGMLLDNRAVSLRRLGRPQEALESSDEAIKLLHRAVLEYPDMFTDHFAIVLYNRSTILHDSKRHDEAFRTALLAIDRLRPVAERAPSRYGLKLANLLCGHAVNLSRFKSREEAAEILLEALSLLRRLERTSSPVAHLIDQIESKFHLLTGHELDE